MKDIGFGFEKVNQNHITKWIFFKMTALLAQNSSNRICPSRSSWSFLGNRRHWDVLERVREKCGSGIWKRSGCVVCII